MRTLRKSCARLVGALLTAGSLLLAAPASADVVTDWNATAVTILGTAGLRPQGASVNVDFAMVHIAIHDAVQAYQHRFRTYGPPIPNASGSPVAAVASAARDVLVARLQIPTVNNALITQVNTTYTNYLISKGLAVNDPGVAVGAQAALNIVLNRANDGFFPANPEIWNGRTEIGQWRPTPPLNLPMTSPWLGDVTPFVLKDRVGGLHEAGPPHLTSGLYTRDYNEVKLMGRRTNSGRTAEQTTFARFFSGNFIVMLYGVVRQVSTARLTDIGDSARLFAIASAALADSGINVWANKRIYNFWRPITAINTADDGNPRTQPDADWLPLIDTPPYPDYTSGANGVTGAVTRSLEDFFGDDVWSFTVSTTATENNQPIPARTYHSFSALADDVVEARILLGIHFRFADTVARREGKQTADQVFAHAFQPLD